MSSAGARVSDEDVQLALDTLNAHAPNLPVDYFIGMSAEEEEASLATGRIYASLELRLRHGGISKEARGRVIERVVAGLHSNNPRERMMAIAAACYGRLVADAEVRAKVVALESDEVRMVREQAVRQLAHYDKIAALEKAGQWSEPKPPWRQ